MVWDHNDSKHNDSKTEIAVMTSDLIIHREFINNVDNLPIDDILFLIVSCLDDKNPRLNGRRRLLEAYGNDHYSLLVRHGWVMVYGWDDGDFEWKRFQTDTPFKELTLPDHLPLSNYAYNFNGGQLGDTPEHPDWLAALEKFQVEMH